MEDKIKELIIDQVGCLEDVIKPEALLVDDLDFDSLDLVEFVMGLEEELGPEIGDEDAEKLKTVQDVYDLMKKLVG